MIKLSLRLDDYQLTYEKKKLKAIFRAAGNEVIAVAKRNIRSVAAAGRFYSGAGGSAAAYRGGYKKGRFRASAAGQSPASITGTLARSLRVKVFPNGQGVSLRDSAFYAKFLEVGATGGGPPPKGQGKLRGKAAKNAARSRRVLAPRPFLSLALSERESSIRSRIIASIDQDIKFVRLPARVKI